MLKNSIKFSVRTTLAVKNCVNAGMNSVEANVSIITEKTGNKIMYIDLLETE